MPKILCSLTSPYSAKVRMAATYAGFAFESELVDTSLQPANLLAVNPLGKIPVLVLDDGSSIYDSRAITQYLNRQTKNALFPRNAEKRTEAEGLEALADGITDCAFIHVTERRTYGEAASQAFLDKQWGKIERGLDLLEANPPRLGSKIHVGHMALRAVLGYLDMRFAGQWEKRRGKLRRWAARFDEKFPELKAFLPRQP